MVIIIVVVMFVCVCVWFRTCVVYYHVILIISGTFSVAT